MASIRTPLCDQLGIDYPIFSVGFGEGATPELVAAVSGAGGCCVLGGCAPGEIRKLLAVALRLADRPDRQDISAANFDHPPRLDRDGADRLWLATRPGSILPTSSELSTAPPPTPSWWTICSTSDGPIRGIGCCATASWRNGKRPADRRLDGDRSNTCRLVCAGVPGDLWSNGNATRRE